ncbi:MAG: putative sugar O-methyltransferase [Oligoflexales bacterium]|nr:putative sugar O-methyltransferase [Oligoflexales bacterium]
MKLENREKTLHPQQSKKILDLLTPPIISKIKNRINIQRFDFKKWFEAFKTQEKLPEDLVTMIEYFLKTPEYQDSSKFWNHLNKQNIQQIQREGLENIKQTVALNYFTWVNDLAIGYSSGLIKEVTPINIMIPFQEIMKKHMLFSNSQSISFNLFTVVLYHYVKSIGITQEQMLAARDPLEGNPPSIEIEGMQVSQDMLNSLLEFKSINKGMKNSDFKSVLEVGAGYGRTAYCLMNLVPGLKYYIVDIPPALYISQSYLSKVLLGKNVFKFRPIISSKQNSAEMEQADIVFITPDQLQFLKDKSIDIVIAISSIHEMKREAVKFYFDAADRLANNFYYKCWEKQSIVTENINYGIEDYPIKKHWQKIFLNKTVVPSDFFEAFYKL